MKNFTYQNPVNIIFGKNSVEKLPSLLNREHKIMLLYGMGSIKKNGLYQKLQQTLKDFSLVEFGGIEANPDYVTCMKAVELAKNERVDFLLSVGGGSVLDGVKFIAAAAQYPGEDPWELLTQKQTVKVKSALPIGCILTIPATGSEMNRFSVMSRRETGEKLAFGSPLLHPQFSILDPELTYSLDERQTANGVVDAFVHVMEQYCTFDVNSPLQDRQSEAILKTLVEEGPKVMSAPEDYDARANIMWCATAALNGVTACGTVQDWSTHMIGHELTATYGLDHARSLAVVMPALYDFKKKEKMQKFVQYGRRVWHIVKGSDDEVFEKAMSKTVEFFNSLGVPTRLSDYQITDEKFAMIAERLAGRGVMLGENSDIGQAEIEAILQRAI